MPRPSIPFSVPDLSAFARAVARELSARRGAPPPGHVETLNLLARAAGHRNVQAFRASLRAAARDAAPSPQLSDRARKALQQFDAHGRLVRLPSKYSVLKLTLWPLWTRFEPRRVYTEKEVNEVLKAANTFGDHVTLRRELVEQALLTRKDDCSEYRKLPATPDAEARALLAAWRERQRVSSAAAAG